jgi:hypothetical protein
MSEPTTHIKLLHIERLSYGWYLFWIFFYHFEFCWNLMNFFLFFKGQHMISYCQRPPISLKILLNISSLISAQFCKINMRFHRAEYNNIERDDVSLSKICHEWPNNTVTHECAQRMSELQRYLVTSDIFLIMKLVN